MVSERARWRGWVTIAPADGEASNAAVGQYPAAGWVNSSPPLKARRSHQTERAAEARVAHAAFDLCAGTYALADLIERSTARPAAERPDGEAPGAEGLFARLVARRALLPRDAALLLRVHVRREPIADAAAALGLRFEAARKALLRARRRLRECRPLIESLCASPLDAAPDAP